MSKEYIALTRKKGVTDNDIGRLLVRDFLAGYHNEPILTNLEREELINKASAQWHACLSAISTFKERYIKVQYELWATELLFDKQYSCIQEMERERANHRFADDELIGVSVSMAKHTVEQTISYYTQATALTILARVLEPVTRIKGFASELVGVEDAEQQYSGFASATAKTVNDCITHYRDLINTPVFKQDLTEVVPVYIYTEKQIQAVYSFIRATIEFNKHTTEQAYNSTFYLTINRLNEYQKEWRKIEQLRREIEIEYK